MSTTIRSTRVLAGALAGLALVGTLSPGVAHATRDVVCANAPADAFKDVKPGSTHAASIDCIAAYGITVGVGGGNYDPSGWVRRGQMASFLVNFLEVALDTPRSAPSTPTSFTDVDGTTHAANIEIAAEIGITVGRTATTYAPQQPATRAQMATFVVRTLEAAGAQLNATVADAFVDDDGSSHEANINALAAAGIVNGVGDGRYDPGGYVTRAQMATFLANAAGLLHVRGLWDAPSIEGPHAVVVTRTGTSSNTIEILWDRAVTLNATGSQFVVADEWDAAVVTTGTAITHDDLRSIVTLDDALVADGVYWLRVEADVAVDATSVTNAEHSIAFVFAVGSDSGGGGPVVAPSIVRAETDPAQNRLAVTFSEPVTCPTVAGGVAAWSFANGSVVESVSHAEGTPDSIGQTPPSTTCYLVYSVDGVENGDFGTLSYTQPANEAHRVSTAEGTPLPSTANIRVSDTVAPTFVGVTAFAATSSLALTFSEPIQCLSLHGNDLLVELDGASEPISITSYDCTGITTSPVAFVATNALPLFGTVTVSVIGDIFAESEDMTVEPGVRMSFVV